MVTADAASVDPVGARLFALRLSYGLALALECVAAIFLVAATVLVILQVFFRYVLSSPLEWTEELARYTAIWAGLLGATLGVRGNIHFRVLYLLNLFPARRQRLFKRAADILMAMMLLVLLWKGLEYTLDLGVAQLSPGLQISMVWVYGVVPTMAALMLIFIMCELVAGDVWPLFIDAEVSEDALVEKIVLEAERAGGIVASQVKPEEVGSR